MFSASFAPFSASGEQQRVNVTSVSRTMFDSVSPTKFPAITQLRKYVQPPWPMWSPAAAPAAARFPAIVQLWM